MLNSQHIPQVRCSTRDDMMFARVSPTQKERKKERSDDCSCMEMMKHMVWGCILTLIYVEMMYGLYE